MARRFRINSSLRPIRELDSYWTADVMEAIIGLTCGVIYDFIVMPRLVQLKQRRGKHVATAVTHPRL